jgi:DNA-binding response OmpR family regulator
MANILVVDDDEAVTNSLRKFLGGEGHAVVVASDGLEALAILNDLIVDVAIVDIVMPAVDGFTLMRRMQKDQPQVRLVVMSGFDDVMDLAERELGTRLSIKKPFTLEEVRDVIAGALSADSAAE